MKRFEGRMFFAVCAASSLLFATRMFAEDNSGNWFESISHVPTEYILEDTYVGGGDVERGPNKSVRDFDENDSIVHLVFTPRTKLGVLRLGAEWERFSFGLPDHAALPDTLQSVSLVVGLDMQFSDSILVRAEGQPGVYDTEFDNLGYDNLFRIIIMQFIDAYNFDVRAIKKSCVHIVNKDNKIIPFETMNLFYRDDKKEYLERLQAQTV